jgi:hypothetical protein
LSEIFTDFAIIWPVLIRTCFMLLQAKNFEKDEKWEKFFVAVPAGGFST